MSELTLTIMRLGLLVLLWLFVFSLAGVLRSDLYGTRVVARPTSGNGDGRKAPARKGRGPGRRRPTRLVVTSGRLAGTSLPLKESGMLIGRNPECVLVLDDDFASGRHARVYATDEGWFVEDLESTNGTYVGQQRITGAVPLRMGSALRIGRTVIELRN